MTERGLPSVGIGACIALALLAGCAEGERTGPAPTVRVERVIDGDTVVLTRFGKTRLIGVDTPEEGKCGDNAATRFTRRRLEDKTVKVELGKEPKDRYDRTLAYLTREDKMHSLALVEEGYAKALTIPPNDKYAERFEDAEQQAEEQEEGPQAECAERKRRVVARQRARARARERAEARSRRAARLARRLRAAERRARAAERRAARAAERRADRRARRRRGGSSGGGIPKNCSGVNGPIPTPPGDPTGLDGDGDGQACEGR